MRILDYDQSFIGPVAIALGYFDCVHVGHRALIDRVVESGYTPSVFSFSGNPFSAVGSTASPIYTLDARIKLFESVGLEVAFLAEPTAGFMSTDREEFLHKLTSNKDVKLLVTGDDFTFGYRRSGDVAFLRDYCDRHGIALEVVPAVTIDGVRVSSTIIRTALTQGDMERANTMLGYIYSLSGVVERGRGVGKHATYPTVNISLEDTMLKRGVYVTDVTVDGETVRGITNVGAHPTFRDERENIETYLIDTDIDCYGKEIKVSFLHYVRPISDFGSADELKARITRDIAIAKEY